ncbi:hypothetical protein Syun_025639 [Stephania yunnanensis]|uniref:Uncharacterized protein n=1 Tax=Stephania yunnanensis TaxID=152371 RepID=A0AAP0HVC2_9MAGN
MAGEDEIQNNETKQVMKVLDSLKQASQDLQNNHSNSTIEALLELESEADPIFSIDPNLSNLSNLLSDLKNHLEELHQLKGHSIGSIIRRRFKTHEISRVAGAIQTQIQAWIDRENIEILVETLQGSDEDENKVRILTQFAERVSQGFNRDLQDLVLKSKVFSVLELTLCDAKSSKRVRESAASAVGALVQFNKDVFVGEVLMGHAVKALIDMGTNCSIKVLCTLIRSIKSPLVDEIEANKETPKIISFLSSEDLAIKVIAFDCVLEIGYFGRKEAIEAMLEEGLIKRLVELQRSELGGDLIEMGSGHRMGDESSRDMEKYLEDHPFASCVARFAIQLEVGEGLRQREKRMLKQVILRRVREACASEAVAATILAEVLWGASL